MTAAAAEAAAAAVTAAARGPRAAAATQAPPTAAIRNQVSWPKAPTGGGSGLPVESVRPCLGGGPMLWVPRSLLKRVILSLKEILYERNIGGDLQVCHFKEA